MNINSISQDDFLKNVNALKIRDAQKRMTPYNTNNLYSTTNDGIIMSDSSNNYIKSKVWL